MNSNPIIKNGSENMAELVGVPINTDYLDSDDMYVIGSGDGASQIMEEYESDPTEMNNAITYTNAIGQTGNPNTPTGFGGEDALTASTGNDGLKILGMPLSYSPLDDPMKRVFKSTFETDLPLVFINPGKPKLNVKLFGKTSDGGDSFSLFGVGKKLVNAAGTLFNVARAEGSRFVSFRSNYSEYYKYMQTMGMSLYQSMGIEGNFSFSNYLGQNAYGIPFYANASTSISESSSNDYGPSTIASETNQRQQQIRESKTYAGINGLGDKIVENVKQTVKDVTTNIPVLGGLVGAFTESLDGSQMYYPDFWSDSSFSRDYDLQFKFYSPYGDAESIFRYVYIPFLSVLVLGMPLQDSFYSYKQPFLTRVSCPGRFECECGIISNISFTRGEERMWTTEGFPREITISLSIKDLYPNLMATKFANRLKYNIGLTSFIECMAGIRFDQMTIAQRADRKLREITNRSTEMLSFRNLDNYGKQFGYNMNNTIANFMR